VLAVEDAPVLVKGVTAAALGVSGVTGPLVHCRLHKFQRGSVPMRSNLHNDTFPVLAIPMSQVNGLSLLAFGEDHELAALRTI
jgi:hypothetical protein